MKNYKKIIIFILIPLIAGGIGYLLSGGTSIYSTIVKPSFAPPSIIFPIAWTILYILMGISSYIISENNHEHTEISFKLYITQLIVNILWPLFFFRFNLYFFSFVWLILLLALVIYMVYLFYKIKPIAAYLQIPYILWLIFAGILNYAIYTLN